MISCIYLFNLKRRNLDSILHVALGVRMGCLGCANKTVSFVLTVGVWKWVRSICIWICLAADIDLIAVLFFALCVDTQKPSNEFALGKTDYWLCCFYSLCESFHSVKAIQSAGFLWDWGCKPLQPVTVIEVNKKTACLHLRHLRCSYKWTVKFTRPWLLQ